MLKIKDVNYKSDFYDYAIGNYALGEGFTYVRTPFSFFSNSYINQDELNDFQMNYQSDDYVSNRKYSSAFYSLFKKNGLAYKCEMFNRDLNQKEENLLINKLSHLNGSANVKEGGLKTHVTFSLSYICVGHDVYPRIIANIFAVGHLGILQSCRNITSYINPHFGTNKVLDDYFKNDNLEALKNVDKNGVANGDSDSYLEYFTSNRTMNKVGIYSKAFGSVEDCFKFLVDEGFLKEKAYKNLLDGRIGEKSIKVLNEFLGKDKMDASNILRKLGVPVAVFDIGRKVIIANSNLKDLGFSENEFSTKIYQEVSVFLSNDLAKREVVKEPDNDIKILSKGFDLKSSFRKM